jgi:hypothetical protein
MIYSNKSVGYQLKRPQERAIQTHQKPDCIRTLWSGTRNLCILLTLLCISFMPYPTDSDIPSSRSRLELPAMVSFISVMVDQCRKPRVQSHFDPIVRCARIFRHLLNDLRLTQRTGTRSRSSAVYWKDLKSTDCPDELSLDSQRVQG